MYIDTHIDMYQNTTRVQNNAIDIPGKLFNPYKGTLKSTEKSFYNIMQFITNKCVLLCPHGNMIIIKTVDGNTGTKVIVL